MLRVGVTFLLIAVTCAAALEHFDNFREGSCMKVQPARVKRDFLDSLKYFSGGAKYNLYYLASSLPNYASLREDQFYYDACYQRNVSTVDSFSIGATFGFGQTLFTFYVNNRPGIYFEAIPANAAQSGNRVEQIVTLTDNKNYAFIVQCWSGTNQRSWALVTGDPNLLDLETERMIADHAESLGFNRDHFIFLRHDSCRSPSANHHNRGRWLVR